VSQFTGTEKGGSSRVRTQYYMNFELVALIYFQICVNTLAVTFHHYSMTLHDLLMIKSVNGLLICTG